MKWPKLQSKQTNIAMLKSSVGLNIKNTYNLTSSGSRDYTQNKFLTIYITCDSLMVIY